MRLTRFLITLSSIGMLLVTNSVSAEASQAVPQNPSSQIILSSNWFFETNQADRQQLMVSGGCDVNGDGYADVVVGNRDYDVSSYIANGRAWLYYGGPAGLSSTPGRIFDPPEADYNGYFGGQVSCAGDVNGDGYDDIMIGMENYDQAQADEGAVFVWYGSATGPRAAYDWMARGDNYYAHFGLSLDPAGDVNGDGYDDIIVGAWQYDCNIISNAYVWYGGPGGLGPNGTPANADWTASDAFPDLCDYSGGDAFGQSVRGIGDVNGDGYADVMVGAEKYSGGITKQGAVFVWYGSASGLGAAGTLANADWMAVGGQATSIFGWSGDGVGDLNHDGFDDLAVGAYYYTHPEGTEGAVFVWYGSASGLGSNGSPANADWTAEANAFALLGYSVRPAGDVNGDGYADLLATAPYLAVQSQSGTLTNAGAWFVWFGGADGLGDNGTPANADIAGYSDQASASLGRDDSGAGDVNGDGKDDILVAAWHYDHGETDEGVVFGYYSPYRTIYLPMLLRS